MKNKLYMAIDERTGETFHGLVHPRKNLIERTGFKHVSKMYVNDNAGNTFHVGYVIGPYWFNVYEVIPMRKTA